MYDGQLRVYREGRELFADWVYQITGTRMTVQQFLTQPEFYIAHRGSGGNWPEHTMTSYTGAARWGMQAIEVSVHISADGELVCLHDENVLGVTGVDALVGSMTWAQLSELTVTAGRTDNSTQPRAAFTRVRDVLDLFLRIDPHVLFVEAKHNDALESLIAMLDRYDNARDYVVWKRWINDPSHERMHADGYTTWGYALNESSHFAIIDDLANRPYLDMIGVWATRPDEEIGPIVQKATAAGKPSIMWEVPDIATRDRARALGVRGFMTSNIRNVRPHRAAITSEDTL